MATLHYWDGDDETDLNSGKIQYWNGSSLRNFDGTPSLSYWNGQNEFDILPAPQPPTEPRYAVATAGHASAKVYFSPPSTSNGAITGYIATASPGGASATGTTSPIRITGLSNDTNYTFRVRARNAAGYSDYSDTTNRVTPKAVIPGEQLQYKTVSVSLDMSTPLSIYEKELDRIADHGGAVVLVILDYIDSPTGYTFTRIPTSRVRAMCQAIRSRGIEINMIKPHIATMDGGDGFYRGNYMPSNVPQFFANWTGEMQHFVGFCNDYGADLLCVSCEQNLLTHSDYTIYWQALKDSVNQTQPAVKLTAAFTTLELLHIYDYWIPQQKPHLARILDVIGINSWIRLTNKVYTPDSPNITVSELSQGWHTSAQGDTHMARLESVCSDLGKKYFVTEVGVRPYTGALSTMESGQVPSGSLNYDVQGLLFRSVFAALTNTPRCIGVSIWHAHEPFNYFDTSNSRIYPGELAIREAFGA